MTGRPGHRTMEMSGRSTVSYLVRTPRVPFFMLVLIGLEAKNPLAFQGRRGIASVVRWNLRPVIFGVDVYSSMGNGVWSEMCRWLKGAVYIDNHMSAVVNSCEMGWERRKRQIFPVIIIIYPPLQKTLTQKPSRGIIFGIQKKKGLPLPLGCGVCETKSKNGRSRPRKPFISRVFCA